MLRKKEYLGILKKGLSKIQAVQLFNEKYHPKPAIRIVERNYHAGRYKAELFCDNCGHRFEREYLTGDKPSKEDCCCPECGFGITYQEQYYRENDCYCLSDINKAYSLVFDGEKVIQPTFVLFERVWYDEKEYHLIRRFHFDLERGQISSVCMYRGMIIPEEAENNFALLYEKDNGGIAVSRAESPYNWFIKYSYDTPSMGNFHRLGQTDAEAADKRPNENLIRSFCTLLNHSMKYYSKESVTIRSTFDQYPVESVPKKLESHKVFAEDHGDYVVMRAFEDNGDTITEQRRWIYSYKNRVNILLRFSGGGWRDYSDNMSYGFYDEEFLAVKPVLEHSIVGKLGVYLYLEKKDDIFHRRTQDAQHYLQGVLKKPVVESLLKVGMEQLIDEVINGELSVQPAAKTLWQKLKLSKANYRFALQEKLNPAEVKKLQKINAIDPAADREAFRKWVERHSTAEPYQFERIHDLTGCRLKEIVDYLESAYFEQGCESAEAVSLWADYLSMYHQYYGRNVKGAEELYPDSLKKAHDVLAMRNGKWLTSYDRVGSSFKEINEKWLSLEWEDRNFKIILPKNSRELVLEGEALHHCVGSYVQQVVDEKCLILFIRRKGNEEKSFFTMEYDLNGKIQQIKGMSNYTIADIPPSNQQLKRSLEAFLIRWGKRTHIDVGIEPEGRKAA